MVEIKNKILRVIKIDQSGNMKEETDFDNITKWDNPSIVAALRNKLRDKRK